MGINASRRALGHRSVEPQEHDRPLQLLDMAFGELGLTLVRLYVSVGTYGQTHLDPNNPRTVD